MGNNLIRQKRCFSRLFFFLLFFWVFFWNQTAEAGVDDVIIHYMNGLTATAYGEYPKCAGTAPINAVIENPSETSHILTWPTEVSITGLNGTRHDLSNRQYAVMTSTDFRDINNRNMVDFTGDTVVIPPHTIYLLYGIINNFYKYNCYWNTDTFLTMQVDGESVVLQGVEKQRGNGCPADQTITMTVLQAGYNPDGSNGTVTLLLDNTMLDGASIGVDPLLTWEGKTSGSTENAITWDEQNFILGSGEQKVINGTFSLTSQIASENDSLFLKFFAYWPTSLFFGNAQAGIEVSPYDEIIPVVEAAYDGNGSNGTILIKLTNQMEKAATINLPSNGVLREPSLHSIENGGAIAYQWEGGGTISIPAGGNTTVNGSFSFDNTNTAAFYPILMMTADLSYSSEGSSDSSFSASGPAIRNYYQNFNIRTINFCRDFTANGKQINFEYMVRNENDIYVQAQLASTLGIEGVSYYPLITYTGCTSSGSSCSERVNEHQYITFKPWEAITFDGTVTLTDSLSSDSPYIYSSMPFYPNWVTKYLSLGRTTHSCDEPISPIILTATPTSVSTASITPTHTVTLSSGTTETPAMTPTNNENPIIEPTVEGTETQTSEPVASFTPTETQAAAEPDLQIVVQNGTYDACGKDSLVRFGFAITNYGMAEGTVNLADIYYYQDETVLTGITYTSCLVQEMKGVDPGCLDAINKKAITIGPGQTLSIEASYQPTAPITTDRTSFSAASSGDNGLAFTVEAVLMNDYCHSNVSPVFNKNGESLSSDIDLSETLTSSLRITLENSGETDALITPKTIYFHTAAIDTYSGVSIIEPLTAASDSKDTILIHSNESFILPAQSRGLISMDYSFTNNTISTGDLDVSWIMKIGPETENFTGVIHITNLDKATATPGATSTASISTPTTLVLPTDTSTPIVVPVRTSTPQIVPTQTLQIPAATPVLSPTATAAAAMPGGTVSSPARIEFWKTDIINPAMERQLPATGFPAGKHTILPAKPVSAVYENISGLHIEIPTLGVSANILSVPKTETSWAVEWLGDQTGIISDGILPGKGTAIIAGHNHINLGTAGPFAFLISLETNDRIFITDEEDPLLEYRVYKNELFSPEESSRVYEEAAPGSLVLVTCESEKPEGGYAYRRVVFAEPLG